MNLGGLFAHQQNREDNHQQAFEKDQTENELTSNRTRFEPTHDVPPTLLANLHRGGAGQLGFNILCDLTAVETAILNENFVGPRTSDDYSSEVETGYVALQRLRIAGRTAVHAFHADAERGQKIKVGMVSRQRKDVVLLQGNGSSERLQLDRVLRNGRNRARKIGSDFAILDAIVDVGQNPV